MKNQKEMLLDILECLKNDREQATSLAKVIETIEFEDSFYNKIILLLSSVLKKIDNEEAKIKLKKWMEYINKIKKLEKEQENIDTDNILKQI